MLRTKEKKTFYLEMIESELKDRDLLLKSSKIIDQLRTRFGKMEKGFNSTSILRKIRESHLK